jgi:L-fucose mutarotase/ribose pyranase (RbsD/FucU family)
MAFKGTLKEFDVPDILQLLSLQKKTGVLTFTRKGGFITLLFEGGQITGVDAFPKKLEQRYGNVLVKQGVISRENLDKALTVQKRTNQKVGEILKGMGIIDEVAISEALRTQAIEIVLSLFKWRQAEYNFKVLKNIDSDLKTIEPIPTDNIIMEGVQMLDEWPKMKEKISNEMIIFEPVEIDQKDIKIIDEFSEERSEAGKICLSPSEAKLIGLINGKNTVKHMVESGIFTEYKVYKCLYSLIGKKIIIKKKISKESEDDIINLEEYIISNELNHKKITALSLVLIIFLIMVYIFSFSKPIGKVDVFKKVQIFKKLLSGIDKTSSK